MQLWRRSRSRRRRQSNAQYCDDCKRQRNMRNGENGNSSSSSILYVLLLQYYYHYYIIITIYYQIILPLFYAYFLAATILSIVVLQPCCRCCRRRWVLWSTSLSIGAVADGTVSLVHLLPNHCLHTPPSFNFSAPPFFIDTSLQPANLHGRVAWLIVVLSALIAHNTLISLIFDTVHVNY